jgi:hypothetical protein
VAAMRCVGDLASEASELCGGREAAVRRGGCTATRLAVHNWRAAWRRHVDKVVAGAEPTRGMTRHSGGATL